MSSWKARFRSLGNATVERDTEADETLSSLNREWRRHIISHQVGLRPEIDPAHDHLRGVADAPVTLVEYGNFQSVTCRTAAPALNELRARFGGDLCFVFRHFPIGDAHPLALQAAAAAEAAGDQDRFWEMHDAMFQAEAGLEPGMLRDLASDLDIDMEQFDLALAGSEYLQHVFEDLDSGTRSGVNGAPTFFINGRRLDWDFDLVTLGKAVDDANGAPAEAPA